MRKILNADVASYYPSLIIKYDYISRNVKDSKLFEQVYNTRLKAKKEGDKKVANALKLVLNTTYGASNNKYNNLYDPLKAKSVCISGQLFLIQLINTLNERIVDFQLIQSNTDGILFSYPEEENDKVLATLREWEELTGFLLEEDEVERIIQKDVNNYIMKLKNGKIKLKGAYVSDIDSSFKHNSLSIVCRAIVDYLLDGVPVEETINNCDDILQFQMITKAGRSYNKVVLMEGDDEIETQRVNRIYASKDKKYGTLYKVKYLEDGKIRKDKVANAPPNCLIDNENIADISQIDKQWYVELAKKRISDFEGGKSIMGEENVKVEEMKSVKETKKSKAKGKNIYEKVYDLQVFLNNYNFVKDGYNQAQGYEYVKAEQYRTALKLGCIENRLIFKVDMLDVDFRNLEKSDKMYLTTITCRLTLTDIDTGDTWDSLMVASGADMLDKGVYKAESLLIKYYITNNFLAGDNVPIDPEEESILPPKNKGYVSPEKQVEIKNDIIKEPTQNVEGELIDTLIGLIEKIRTVEGLENYGESTYISLKENKITDLFQANNIMIKLEEKINELGI